MIKLIGVYDYTVILTYLSLISSVFGMTQAIHGDYKMAIFCLAFCSGVIPHHLPIGILLSIL